MKPITRRPEVDTDLERYWQHLAAHNVDAADRFLDAVEKGFRAIQLTPAIGRLRRWKDKRLAGIRSWRVPGYRNWLVFYRETPASIDVIRVLHGMMDLETKITQDL